MRSDVLSAAIDPSNDGGDGGDEELDLGWLHGTTGVWAHGTRVRVRVWSVRSCARHGVRKFWRVVAWMDNGSRLGGIRAMGAL